MSIRSFKGVLLANLMIFSIIALAIPLLSTGTVHATLIPFHDPIHIVGNDNFTAVNGVIAGSGTASDPYVIANWDINASNADGIEIENTTAYVVVRNCFVHDGKSKDGIYFHDMSNGKIQNNHVTNNNGFSGGGIELFKVDNVLILNNTLENNQTAIDLAFMNNIIISNNLLKNNPLGIYFYLNADNNLILNNTLENNEIGIYVHASDYNRIYHNNFVNNVAYDYNITYWDNGYPSGGNYWSDYTGKDADGDGIGDTPYNIPIAPFNIPQDNYGHHSQDRYPLMKLFSEVPSGPSGGSNLPIIAGIVGAIVVICIVVTVYVRRR